MVELPGWKPQWRKFRGNTLTTSVYWGLTMLQLHSSAKCFISIIFSKYSPQLGEQVGLLQYVPFADERNQELNN